MEITVVASPSETQEKTFTFSLSDFGLTKKEWDKMSNAEKEKAIQSALDDEPEQPYWRLDSFSE